VHVGISPLGGVGVGVGAGVLVGVGEIDGAGETDGIGEMVSFAGTADGKAVEDGAREGETVERAVGKGVGDAGIGDADGTRVGKKGVAVGSAAHPDCVGVGRSPNTSIWLSRNPPASMQALRSAMASPPTSCTSPAGLLRLAFVCSPTVAL
jgi:hypothetical protein